MGKNLAGYQDEAVAAGITLKGDETIKEIKGLIAAKAQNPDIEPTPEPVVGEIPEEPTDDNFDISDPEDDPEVEEQPEEQPDTKAAPKMKTCKGLFAQFANDEENFPGGGEYSAAYYESKGIEAPKAKDSEQE